MTTRRLSYLMLALAMMTVGSTVIASKWIGKALPPFVATAIRFAIAAPLLLVLLRLKQVSFILPGWRDSLLLITQAAAGSVGYTVFLILGSTRTSAASAGIILGCLPAVAACVSSMILRQPMNAPMRRAIALATLGVLAVSASGAFSDIGSAGLGSLGGDLLILLAVLCESLFILLNRKLHHPLPPLFLAFVMCVLGLLLSLPFAIHEYMRGTIVWEPMSLWACAYYALVPTVLGFYLWYSGSAMLSAHEASLMTSVAPLSAVLFSVLFMHERLTVMQVLGLSLILVALKVAKSKH